MDDTKSLQAQGWTWGQPAPQGYEYTSDGLLAKSPTFWSRVGKPLAESAGTAGALYATGLTAGGASPWLAAAVGGGSGALRGAATNGAKGAFLGGALGAAGGYAGASLQGANLAAKLGTQTGLGAAQGYASGAGARGALLGAAGGAGSVGIGQLGQNLAQNGSSLVAQALTRAALQGGLNYGLSGGNPYAALGGAASGALVNPYRTQR